MARLNCSMHVKGIHKGQFLPNNQLIDHWSINIQFYWISRHLVNILVSQINSGNTFVQLLIGVELPRKGLMVCYYDHHMYC